MKAFKSCWTLNTLCVLDVNYYTLKFSKIFQSWKKILKKKSFVCKLRIIVRIQKCKRFWFWTKIFFQLWKILQVQFRARHNPSRLKWKRTLKMTISPSIMDGLTNFKDWNTRQLETNTSKEKSTLKLQNWPRRSGKRGKRV